MPSAGSDLVRWRASPPEKTCGRARNSPTPDRHGSHDEHRGASLTSPALGGRPDRLPDLQRTGRRLLEGVQGRAGHRLRRGCRQLLLLPEQWQRSGARGWRQVPQMPRLVPLLLGQQAPCQHLRRRRLLRRPRDVGRGHPRPLVRRDRLRRVRVRAQPAPAAAPRAGRPRHADAAADAHDRRDARPALARSAAWHACRHRGGLPPGRRRVPGRGLLPRPVGLPRPVRLRRWDGRRRRGYGLPR